MKIKSFNELNEGPSDSSSDQSKPLGIKFVIKGDKDAAKLAKELVGDGQEPNMYFVTVSNDFYVQDGATLSLYSEIYKTSPVDGEKQIEVETIGPFEKSKDALKEAESIGLSETIGPRYVMIEDRKSGLVYERYLKAEKRTVWTEDSNITSELDGGKK